MKNLKLSIRLAVISILNLAAASPAVAVPSNVMSRNGLSGVEIHQWGGPRSASTQTVIGLRTRKMIGSWSFTGREVCYLKSTRYADGSPSVFSISIADDLSLNIPEDRYAAAIVNDERETRLPLPLAGNPLVGMYQSAVERVAREFYGSTSANKMRGTLVTSTNSNDSQRIVNALGSEKNLSLLVKLCNNAAK